MILIIFLFSYNQANHLYSVESSQSSNGKYTLKSSIYECNKNMVGSKNVFNFYVYFIIMVQISHLLIFIYYIFIVFKGKQSHVYCCSSKR